MKVTRMALAAALCALCAAANAQAQVEFVPVDTSAPAENVLVSNHTLLGASQKDGGKGGKGGKGDDRLRLFGDWGNGWELNGHMALGVTLNADNPASRYNGPMTFNDREGEVQFNQTYLSLGREADGSGCGWGWGGRIDLLYGSDYIFTQAAGLETQPDFSNAWNGHRHYGLAMPQAYVELARNDLSVQIGHFYTIMGYEVVDATGNFFYSHAYTMQYGEPFTHTGALATWDYSHDWTLYGGLVNGWDAFDQTTDRLAFLGGFTYDPCDRDYTFTATFISGEQDGFAPPVTVRNGYSLVFDWAINDRLSYVLQHDNFWQEDVFGPGVDAEWYGLNQYFFYTVNDCWTLGARIEWFRDDDGARLGGTTPLRETAFGLPANPTLATAGAAAGHYYNITLGANWSPASCDRLMVRPEVRWDWSGGTVGQPFDSKDSMFTAGMDAILTF